MRIGITDGKFSSIHLFDEKEMDQQLCLRYREQPKKGTKQVRHDMGISGCL
jgi:hypothetical protein